MSPELVGAAGFVVLLLLMFLGMPIGVCMILVGVAGYAIFSGVNQSLGMAGLKVISALPDYTLATLPIYLLMGELADISGMMRDAYRSANIWLGNLRGGLAMASILGAAGFSAVSGTSMACAAVMARIALPRLLEYKYDPRLATGALAAGGTLGNLIPPGIYLVFYAVIAEESLGKLMVACLLPAALLVVMYMVQIYIQCRLNPALGPRGASATWKERLYATKYMAAILIVFGLVLGGVWFGIYTPNEGASFGVVFVFIFALMRRTLNGQNLSEAFKNTLVTSGMAFAIIIGANVFAAFTTISHLPQTLIAWLTELNLSSLGVILLIMLAYFILGIPMTGLTIILLTMPILVPVLKAYNIDLIWFGVLAIIQCELANLSPPVGMNLFVVAAIAKPQGISMSTVFAGALPFCVTMLVFNGLLIAFPQIAMYLVSQMK